MHAALTLDHWIFDMRFIKSQCNCHPDSNEPARPVSVTDLQIVAALSNNSIALFSISESFFMHPIKIFKCTERALVFSMRLCILPFNNDRTAVERSDEFGCEHRIAIASGTAFSRILLWSTPSATNSLAQSVDCDVQSSLLGHQVRMSDSIHMKLQTHHIVCCVQGPIFDIQWDASGTQLCSVSDDRSVRYWRLNCTPSHSALPITLLHTSVGYGHTSRVWRCAFVSSEASIWVVSSGEDGTLRFWHSETGMVFH
jgi:WD40 repeat protein